MDTLISSFIEKQKLMTLATMDVSGPYCASLFYAFLPEENILVFKSDSETIHIRQAIKKPKVAGTICSIPKTILKLQGVQFLGSFIDLYSHELFALASNKYLQRFPFSGIIKNADFWGISLNQIKMTDNSLGFGKKLLWERVETPVNDPIHVF